MNGGEQQNKLTPLADKYGFTYVYDWVYKCLKLSGNDAIIFSLILSYCKEDGYYGGSFKYIEKRYGITEKTAKRILPKLENKQYIIKQQGDSKTRNKYTINFNVVNSLIKKQQGQNDTRDNLTLGTKCPYPNDKMSLGVGTNCPPSNKYSNKLSNNNIYAQSEIASNSELKNDDSIAEVKQPKQKKQLPSKKEQEEKQARLFDEFWKIYPKKEDRKRALKAWLKIKPDDKLFKKIMDAVEVQSQSDQWQKENGQYVPYGATWLNGERWNDEIKKAAGNSQPQETEPCKKPYYQEPFATF